MASIESDLVSRLRAETSLTAGVCGDVAKHVMGVLKLWKVEGLGEESESGAESPHQALLADGLTELRLYRQILGEHQGEMWRAVDRVVQRYEAALNAEAEVAESDVPQVEA